MALQGTIDSFALGDVLRLLAGSRKTGRLVVNGERGSASLWLVNGDLIGGGPSETALADLVELTFDVLRYESGSFIFEADAVCPFAGDPVPVGAVLDQAETFLSEWRDIVAVVPSMRSWVTLSGTLPHPEVVVDQACWSAVVAVGGGATVESFADSLDLGELPACRLVRALVHAGLLVVGTPVTGLRSIASLPAHPGSDVQPEDPFGRFDPFGSDGAGTDVDGLALPSLTITALSDDPFAGVDELGGSQPAAWEPDAWSDEPSADSGLGLSMLSPAAAQAVAAAEQSGSEAPKGHS